MNPILLYMTWVASFFGTIDAYKEAHEIYRPRNATAERADTKVREWAEVSTRPLAVPAPAQGLEENQLQKDGIETE